MSVRKWLYAGLAAGLAALACPACADEYRDVGKTTDYDNTQNIYFEKEVGFGGSGWPAYWGRTRGFAETNTGFWWCTDPPADTANVIDSRAIKFHHLGRFRVKADGFPAQADLTLTLRYKDDVIGPAPVTVWDGEKWIPVGQIGGQFDHRWKTVQLPVPPARKPDKGAYVFKIGENRYTDSIKGELPLDRIKLGTTKDKREFPADEAGYWPPMPNNNFANLGDTMEFIPGEGPFFPLGVYSDIWISDGGSFTEPGHGAMDSWKILADAGMNCYVIHGWEQGWGKEPRGRVYPQEKNTQWAKPGVLMEPSLGSHLIQAKAHNLKVIPNFLTDTRLYWIVNGPKSEQAALDRLGKAMADLADDPNILSWYPVDEWDHEDGYYAKPFLYSHLLYRTVRENAPKRPGFLLCMGFFGPDTWKLTAKEGDVLAVDIYPSDYKGIEGGLSTQAQRLDDIRSVVGRKTPYILVPQLYEPKKPALTPAQVVAQAYMGFIHGARGIIYFRAVHPANPDAPKDIWVGPKQVSTELFDKTEGIAPFLLPPSKIVDMMGESKRVTVSDPDIHTLLVEDGKGRRLLLALNSKNTDKKGVKITVAGLRPREIGTRFEAGRKLPVAGGAFSDDFGAVSRHVYDLGAR